MRKSPDFRKDIITHQVFEQTESHNPPEVAGIESTESLTNLDLTGEEGMTPQCLMVFSG